MAWKWADNVRETTLSSGSPWTLAGAETGKNAVSTFLSNGDTSDFTIADASHFETGEYSYDSALNKLTLVTLFESSNGNSPVTWGGGSKTVAEAPLAYRFRKLFDSTTGDANRIRFDAAQSLTAAQQAQARSNLSAAQLAAMAAHNSVINGGVDISQELGTTGATLTNNTAKYTADMFEGMYNHGAATAVVTSGQMAAASFPSALAGFSFAHWLKATTAITSPANGDFAKHRIKLEGKRIARWGWGAAGASAVVAAIELYSTASGTALFRLSNGGAARFYHHELTVAAGWNFYAFSVPGDTSGTWPSDNTAGLVVEVFASGKETTPGSTIDAWTATGKIQTTNSGNLLGTNNNLTLLTGVYIDVGTQLPVAADLPQLMRKANEDLPLCEDHLEFAGPGLTGTWENANQVQLGWTFRRTKRANTIISLTTTTPTVSEPKVPADRTGSGSALTINNDGSIYGIRAIINGFSGATAGNGAVVPGSNVSILKADARL